MSTNSASGPDEFGGGFYKSNWSIIKLDLMVSVRSFFNIGMLPENFNPICVCLIPKKNNADRVEHYMPIVLANFHYKIISKILAERLAPIASTIVSTQ